MFLRERRGLIPFHCSNSNSIRGREKKRREKETWAWDKDEDESQESWHKDMWKRRARELQNETEVIFSSLTLHSPLFFFYSLTFLQYRIQWTFLSHTSFNFLLPFSSLFYYIVCFWSVSLLFSCLYFISLTSLASKFHITFGTMKSMGLLTQVYKVKLVSWVRED